MKKWRCTVCNYIHTGEEPPEKCPVCGADKSKFVAISEEEAETYEHRKRGGNAKPAATQPAGARPSPRQSGKEAPSEPPRPGSMVEVVNGQLLKHHAHPMSVHVPNGILPVVVLFMFIAAVFAAESLAQAAFYFMVVVLLSLPFVLYTGYNEWQRKYRGARTKLFIAKLVAAGVVTVSCFLLVIWYFINPDVILAGAARRGGFLILNLIMLGAASVAGYIGGKFVFKD